MKAGSNLEKVLTGGHFALTAELGPPKGNDVGVIEKKVDFYRGKVDAVNITDNQEWMKMIRDLGVHEKVYILAGITPLKLAGMARYMAKNVSGITIPDPIIERMARAQKGAEEGIRICVEQIEELKEIEGVHGIHIMAIEWEHMVGRIAEEAGLLPRPVVD